MKKFFMFFAVLCSFGTTLFAKAVDEATATTVAYNQYKKAGGSGDMKLAYKSVANVNGKEATVFYIFNATSATGFVIVAGDDVIKPVLAYSLESSFYIDKMPRDVAYWMDGYKTQITNAIQKNTVTNAGWATLQNNIPHTAAKTTNAVVAPLLTTAWDQTYYYDRLCPFDAPSNQNTITGCVATAMAQCMKYWNWPVTGQGSHSYTGQYGTLSADFESTTYHWGLMHNVCTQLHNAVDTIMFHAGVSVNMSYGTEAAGGSGSFVLTSSSPITNCAEYALKTYFRYVPTLYGAERYDYSKNDWITLLTTELDAKRPIIYTGFGPQGGHCWMCDGYDDNSNFHFNWGWTGAYNGYYSVDSLEPGGDTFNDGQGALIGVMPDSSNVPVAPLAVNNVSIQDGITVYPNPAKDVINITTDAETIKEIRMIDMAGREVAIWQGGNTKQATANLAVGNVASGMYMLQIQSNAGVSNRKILIAK